MCYFQDEFRKRCTHQARNLKIQTTTDEAGQYEWCSGKMTGWIKDENGQCWFIICDGDTPIPKVEVGETKFEKSCKYY